MTLSFDKGFYDKRALLKAAYAFTDRAYLHLSQDAEHWLVSWEGKEGAAEVSEKAFENELLHQMVRLQVLTETADLRTLMLARAMASTVIDTAAPSDAPAPEDDGTHQAILKDWYHHENDPAL